ncbi:MAG TPA: hypothetical protein VGB54_00940 [Allosphingosinicella sp.]
MSAAGSPRRARPTRLCLLASALGFGLAGCTAVGDYAGVSYATDANPLPLIHLAWDASRGNPRAQLELGMLYESGTGGLPRSLLCAARLYELAALPPNESPEASARLERIRHLVDENVRNTQRRCDDLAQRIQFARSINSEPAGAAAAPKTNE